MKNMIYYLTAGLLEIPVSILGSCSELVRPNYKYELERRLRGKIYSMFFGAGNLKFDTNLQLEGLSNIKLGDAVTLYRSVELVAGSGGSIKIGNHTHVGRKSLINGLGGVVIGSHCAISSHVSFFSITNIPGGGTELGSITVGDSVLIGSGVRVLPGVSIGEGATIGAGAVVNKDVPSHSIVAGIPARPINQPDSV